MNSIVLKAHAKVNIGLQVRDQRKDGFHNIHTVFQELELHDKITLIKQPTSWSIQSDKNNIPIDDKNTCIKAFLAMKNQFPQIGGISIKINKNIPSGAGLGGGSSDAAMVLKGLNQLYNLKVSRYALKNIGAEIGADVPFFIEGGTQIGDGIGEILTPIKKPVEGVYLLVTPNIFISTAWAYGALKKHLEEETDRPNFAHFLEDKILSNAIFDNDFERIVIPTYPKIGEIKAELIAAGANYASLSGSGSTVFGIFDDEVVAKQTEFIFQKHYHTLLTKPTNI